MRSFVFDSHTHSQYSPDADTDLREMCEYAIAHGIDGFCVTDHCDCNHDRPEQDARMAACRQEVKQLREEYRGRLLLCYGMELAQQNFDPAIVARIYGSFEGDFMIGSMHRADNQPDFSVIDFSTIEFEPLLEKYYHELLETAQINKLDILAHITYPLRYAGAERLAGMDLHKYDDITDEIFRTLIQNGKGIEINVSGLRQPYGKPFPTGEYLKRFHDLGGEIVTIGSDAHFPQHVGANFADGVAILKAAGFDHYCYFVERKPRYVDI